MTVAEAQRRISPTEFAEWQVFDALEPSGPYRDNLHAGVIARAIMRSVGVDDYSPEDALLKFEVAPEDETETTFGREELMSLKRMFCG